MAYNVPFSKNNNALVGRHQALSKVYLLVNLFFRGYMLPFFFSGLIPYLVGIKRRTSRHVACKRDNSHFNILKWRTVDGS